MKKFVPKWSKFSGTKYDNSTSAYVINLKRRSDRLLQFKENCPLLHVNVFEAYDGQILRNNTSLKNGELGCAYSHYDLWKLCSTLNRPLVVFEDDAQIRDKFNEIFSTLEKNNFYDINSILFLGGGPRGFGNYKKKIYNDLVSVKISCIHWLRCECYIIFPDFASQLVRDYNFNCPIDLFINKYNNLYMLHSEISYPGNSNNDSDTS